MIWPSRRTSTLSAVRPWMRSRCSTVVYGQDGDAVVLGLHQRPGRRDVPLGRGRPRERDGSSRGSRRRASPRLDARLVGHALKHRRYLWVSDAAVTEAALGSGAVALAAAAPGPPPSCRCERDEARDQAQRAEHRPAAEGAAQTRRGGAAAVCERDRHAGSLRLRPEPALAPAHPLAGVLAAPTGGGAGSVRRGRTADLAREHRVEVLRPVLEAGVAERAGDVVVHDDLAGSSLAARAPKPPRRARSRAASAGSSPAGACCPGSPSRT